MGYSIKWIEENLGITRKAIRYYEEKELLPKNQNSEYRNFNDEEIKRIWYIKTFLNMGFTATELKNLNNLTDKEFYNIMTNKVEELTKEIKEKERVLEVANTVKLTGRIPYLEKLGDMKFDVFIDKVKNDFVIKSPEYEEQLINIMNNVSLTNNNSIYSIDKIEQVKELLGNNEVRMAKIIESYYMLLNEFQDQDYKSEFIQKIVEKFYIYLKNNASSEFTPINFIEDVDPLNYEGDVGIINEIMYGKKGCSYISKAIRYFGKVNKDKSI